MQRDQAYWEAVRRVASEAPPLSEAQRTKLATLLRPVARRRLAERPVAA